MIKRSKGVKWDPNLIEQRKYSTYPIGKMSHLFYQHGRFCASHPWEVMITFLTLSICIFSLGPSAISSSEQRRQTIEQTCLKEQNSQWNANASKHCTSQASSLSIEIFSQCMAIFYVYHQFQNLNKLGSKYLVGISCLFTVLSSVMFCSGFFNFLNGDLSELNKALPFFFLLSDLSKASFLAQFALSSSTREEVRENIAKGMAILGPSLTLDTMVETLAIGVGTLSGVHRLEKISGFACLSVLVNYIVFMTFFPACLSFALELFHNREGATPVWQLSSLKKVLQLELEQKPNPVIQRVKVIMSAGLMLVHTLSRWPIGDENSNDFDEDNSIESTLNSAKINNFAHKEPNSLVLFFVKIFDVGYEQLLMLGLVCALAIRYIFFENRDNYNEHLINQMQLDQRIKTNEESGKESGEKKKNTEKDGESEIPSILITCNDSDTESMIIESLKRNNVNTNSSSTSRSTSRASSTKGESETNKPLFLIGDDFSSDFSETELVDREVQTELSNKDIECLIENDNTKQIATKPKADSIEESKSSLVPRDLNALISIYNTADSLSKLTDLEIQKLVEAKIIPAYKLEATLGSPERGVCVRRRIIESKVSKNDVLKGVPYVNYDYSLVLGACCENVIGYLPLPLGVAGPLLMNGKEYHIPMATTEGCLVASTNRGCRALYLSGGVKSSIFGEGMTRGPVIHFPRADRAVQVKKWLKDENNFEIIKKAFNSTSRYASLQRIQCNIAGRYLYIRFCSSTGDAMGMNMLSKGTEAALKKLHEYFDDMEMTCLSGNFCTDKKPSAVNWIEGRGKSVVCDAIIPKKVVESVLKTSVGSLEKLNISKNLIGSAMAGSIGGFNAQAANIVAAIFIATGQDPAQTVGSSNCITVIEKTDDDHLYASCTMPSVELGTIGGGTILPAQSACLELLGVRGASDTPGSNSSELASVICGAVLAAELSILSALAEGHLVRSHMKLNRSIINMNLASNTVPHSSSNQTILSDQGNICLSPS